MSGSRFNYAKMKRDSKGPKASCLIALSKEKTENEILRDNYRLTHFDREMYCKGTEYYQMGGILDEAKDEFKNNIFFTKGYERGQRLAYVKEVEEKYKKR